MTNTDDFKERFRRWKNGENYWAIRADRDQYDYNRAVELGYGPDGTGHWPSRDYLTGRILKSATHPTIIKSVAEDAVRGYRWNIDKNGDVYSTTWDELEKQRIPTIETPYLPLYSDGKPKKQYVYDVLPGLFAKDGVKIRVSSGYRPGAVVADTGKPSRHSTHLAADIVGDFAQIRKVLDDPNSNVSKWMLANGYGYIDETAKTGTTKYWSPRRRREYEQGISDNSHYHIGADSYYSKLYATQINKQLAQAALAQPSVTYAMQPTVLPEPPAIPVTTKPVNTNKIYGPVESPNANVAGDIIAAIRKMDEEKSNRALDETAGFGSLPNPIAFFNSFCGEDLPTKNMRFIGLYKGGKPIYNIKTNDGLLHSFKWDEDTGDTILDNGIRGTLLLDTVTVTARNPRKYVSAFEGHQDWLRPMADFVPFVGDALQARDAVVDAANGNYLNAGINAGMLLLPNVLEKPVRKGLTTFQKLSKAGKIQNAKSQITRKAQAEVRRAAERRAIQEKLEQYGIDAARVINTNENYVYNEAERAAAIDFLKENPGMKDIINTDVINKYSGDEYMYPWNPRFAKLLPMRKPLKETRFLLDQELKNIR